jgi:hypothetical protein
MLGIKKGWEVGTFKHTYHLPFQTFKMRQNMETIANAYSSINRSSV